MHEDDDFEPVESMDLSGGDISLDFVNTASGRDSGPLQEKLHAYDDLVTWAERVGLVTAEQGRRLRTAAGRSPGEAAAVLRRARDLREAVFRIFARDGTHANDLDLLADEAARGAAERRLSATADGYAYAWPESDRLERLLWPVALAAAELLTSAEDRSRVKECAADNCNWLFLDMSRNRSRRWCDMKVCGNRAKARRFSARHRDA
jgi:predicted RNA-binding Zn ribbon-like protein